MAKVGDTYPVDFKVSFITIGVTTWSTDTVKALVTKWLEGNLEKKAIAAVGSKFIPGIGWASWAAAGVGAIGSYMGYSGIKGTMTMEYVKIEKHQAGQTFTIEGWRPKKISISCYK